MFTRIKINEFINKLSNLKKDLPEESHELIDNACKYIKSMYITDGNINTIDSSGKIIAVSLLNDMPKNEVYNIMKYLSDTLGNEYKLIAIPSDLRLMVMNIRELNNLIDNLIKTRDSIMNDIEIKR